MEKRGVSISNPNLSDKSGEFSSLYHEGGVWSQAIGGLVVKLLQTIFNIRSKHLQLSNAKNDH